MLGFVFIFLNFNLNLNGANVNFLPAFVGYVFFNTTKNEYYKMKAVMAQNMAMNGYTEEYEK